MKSITSMILLTALVGGVPVLTGCEKEVAHTEKTTTTPGGGVKKESTTITENPDGTLKKETETKKVSP